MYVAELGYKAGMWPGTVAPEPDATGGRVSIFDSGGGLLARWGGGSNPWRRAISMRLTIFASIRVAISMWAKWSGRRGEPGSGAGELSFSSEIRPGGFRSCV